MEQERNWEVLLVGGASGLGKTTLCKQLAEKYKVNLLDVDDFYAMLEVMTTAATHPAIHYWNANPEWRSEGIDAAVEHINNAGEEMSPGITAVISRHIEAQSPIILEGEFIMPELAASVMGKKVKAVFLHEEDMEQISENFKIQEGIVQKFRSTLSYAFTHRLSVRFAKLGVPVVSCRPWDTLLDRVLDSIK